MAWCLFCAKPLPKPMLAFCWLDFWKPVLGKLESNTIIFIQENWFEIVCKMPAILSQPHVKQVTHNDNASYGSEYRQTPNVSYTKLINLNVSHLVWQTGDAPTTSEWSTTSLPIEMCLILETLQWLLLKGPKLCSFNPWSYLINIHYDAPGKYIFIKLFPLPIWNMTQSHA